MITRSRPTPHARALGTLAGALALGLGVVVGCTETAPPVADGTQATEAAPSGVVSTPAGELTGDRAVGEVVEVPSVVGLAVVDAEAALEELGLVVDVVGGGGVVVATDPPALHEVSEGATVGLEVADVGPLLTCGALWLPSQTRPPTPDELMVLDHGMRNHSDIELFDVLDEPWEWEVHYLGGQTLQFHGRIGDRNAYAVLINTPGSHGRWIWAAGTPVAECEVIPLEAYELRARVYLDIDHLPGPEDTEMVVFFDERRCSGAAGPIIEGRDVQPVVVETDTAILVTVWTEPDREAAACGGFPRMPFIVSLNQPVGDRVVLDLGQSPAGPVVPIEIIDDGRISTPASLEERGFEIPTNGDQPMFTTEAP